VTGSDQNGKFILRDVAPGTYRLLAWSDLEDGAHLDPDLMKSFEARGKAVRVERNSRTTMDVTVVDE
jgi:hypothetical protein